MNKLIIIVLLFFAWINLSAQNLSGEWTGFIKKRGNNEPYQYALSLTRTEEGYVGRSLIRYFDEEWYCINQVQGRSGGGFFFYAHQDFIEQHHERGAYWLMPRGALQYDPVKEKLVGWVDVYDPYTKSISKRHDYVELYRKKRLVDVVLSLPTIGCR